MFATFNRLATPMVVALLVTACGSATLPATSDRSAIPSTQASSTPRAVMPPASSPTASGDALEPNQVVVTVSDRLRVRSEPRVSDDSIKYDPVLPLGTELFVLDGPVTASGYTWLKVAPLSYADLGGPGFGWVASADKDGTPWIAPATGPTAALAMARSEVSRAGGDPSDAKRAAAAINAFALDVHRALLADPALDLRASNTVFSPTSIQLALAMARAGAKGDTAAEMDQVLGARGWDELGPGLNALEQALASRDAKWEDGEGAKELTLRIANAPFAQRGWSMEQAYLDEIASTFGAGLRLVDYQGDVAGARKTINGWVSDRTAGRIPTLLTPDNLSSDTRLTLVNAMYLKAHWDEWFSQGATTPAPFTRLNGSRIDVPMMQRWGGHELPYARGDGWQASELRYLAPPDAPQLAMLLVLPDDLPEFESGLTADRLSKITAAASRPPEFVDCPGVPADQQDAGCYRYALHLHMPRFGIETRAEMSAILAGMGMPLAFDASGADFSGITKADALHIGMVIHQANIDVDEEGTEAAAATAVGMDTGGGPSPLKDITLRLDRPFLFFVRDIETGAVLFMGRVTDPSAAKGS
jgi:serpin B